MSYYSKVEFALDCMGAAERSARPWTAFQKAVGVFLVWCYALVGWAL